jgi:phosphopantothenoylcysteine decarboxylase/phosphopantothenate--cysteine ligase
MERRHRVLLGVGGGIAAYKSAEVARRLIDRGCYVRCAMTRSAEAFLPALTLEVLSGHAVYRQEYLTATGRGEESHIAAAAWADALCVVPATANLLSRFALGLADDFLTTTALAFEGPLILAPAMHSAMWHHPAVVGHVATLRERDAVLVGPVEGALASGERGIGRLAEPERIADEVIRSLTSGDLEGRRVLISAGPTYEPIDPVRFLGNRSSGKMGFALAAEAARRGAHTTLVAGPVALPTPRGVERVDVETALEMRDAVHRHAPSADLIVMTAAVADFRPERATGHKIKRSKGVPEIELVENPDILAGLEAVAPDALRVGFAAETEPSEEEAYAKLERKRADFLVWNDVSRDDVGFGADDNEVTVYRRSEPPRNVPRASKAAVAAELFDLFSEALKDRERPVASRVG